MQEIILTDHTSYTYFTREIVLDETNYILKFRYNTIKDFWTMEIQNENTETIRIYKCICNYDIMSRDTSPNLPKGKLFFYSEDESKPCARREDFKNGGVRLVYTV